MDPLTIHQRRTHEDAAGRHRIEGYARTAGGYTDFLSASGETAQEAEANWQSRAGIVAAAREKEYGRMEAEA